MDEPNDDRGEIEVRFFIPEQESLWDRINTDPPERSRVLEHVYLDTAHPSLGFTGFVRGRRTVSSDDAALFNGTEPFEVEFRPAAGQDIVPAPEQAALEEIPELVENLTGLEDLVPWFGVRYRRRRLEAKGLIIDVDRELEYHSLLGREPFFVGREAAQRVTIRTKGKPKHNRRLEKLLEDLPRTPNTTKKWMGFYMLQQCYEIPRHDELHGYEYEVKLDVDALEIDTSRLAFPVVEVHQSDSLRHYYQHNRASIRGQSAHYVEKGPKHSIAGVFKRRETKKRGLSPYEIPDPNMVMRRYKREINVVNPDSGRVYTISLHHCDAGKTFQQLEIEYDGRLLPGAATSMAKFRLDHDTRHFRDMATQADAAGHPAIGDELRARYLDLTPSADDGEVILASMTGAELPMGPHDNAAAEQAVIEDMVLLRESILRQGGSRPSRTTKRRWLRRVYAKRA